jgi:signal transduction histidine kinase
VVGFVETLDLTVLYDKIEAREGTAGRPAADPAVCRSIIEAHDGRLWVAPNKPEGAVFQFTLLADGETSAAASRRQQPEALPPGLRI